MKAISADTMRELDNATIESGTAGEVLMERAGYGSFRELMEFCEGMFSEHAKRFLVLCGKGNNGGDGHVIARYLHEAGLDVCVVSMCPIDDLKGDALLNAERLDDEITLVIEPDSLKRYLQPGTIVIDALLGTGIAGEVREPYKTLITEVNESGLPVVAIDIPSGLNAETGEVANVATVADLTITMAQPKTGLLQGDGTNCTGMLRVVDIGILPEKAEAAKSPFDAVTAADVAPILGRIPSAAHKGTLGRIMVIGGCNRYPGALILSGTACARSGGGLVTIAFPTGIYSMLPTRSAALIMQPVSDNGECRHANVTQNLRDGIAQQDVLAIGPGIGPAEDTMRVVAELLRSDKPVVLDADGLRAVAIADDAFPRQAPTVLTPHPGEMRRLIQGIGRDDLLDADRQTQAVEVAKALDAVVVLKGAHSVIAAADGRVAVNTSGSPALASGGSGDVLTGMIAAWLAQLDDAFEAAKVATFIHGYAAEIAPDAKRGLIADDLVELISPAMANLSPHA